VKILIYTHEFPPYYGGAGMYAYELADGLYKLGQNICVLAPTFGSEDSSIDKNTEFGIIRRPLRGKSILTNLLFLTQTLLKERPDITMVVECSAQMRAAKIMRILTSYPYIITVHGSEIWSYFDAHKGYFNLTPKAERRMRKFFLDSRQLIAVCNSTKKLILEYLPKARENITVVHNGISLEAFPLLKKTEIEEQRSTLRLKNKKVLLCVSRLARSKGYEVLLLAFKEILKVLPETVLLIVGEGPMKGNVEALARELQCGREVRFLGKISRSELYIYYNICDLFVLASQMEAFPFVCLEANACKKAVVAGRTGGIPEIIEDGINGVLVDPYNANEFVKVIINLLQDDARRNAMGRNGRIRVSNEFTKIHMAKKTLEVIQEILK
jgi:glycosyltransferase involved in cell wall biosynthesis